MRSHISRHHGESRPLLGDRRPSKTIADESTIPDERREPSALQIALTMALVWPGCFLAALDGTITSTLSATIATDLSSLALISWLGSAYLVANAAVQPLSGKLTDIFSRRAGLLLCSAFFAVGNLVCGLAENQLTMIAGRLCAGMGGGGLIAISTFVGTDIIPLRKRGVWHGLGNIIYGVGTGLGGLVGGAINDNFGWRWAFLIMAPLTLVSATAVFFGLPNTPPVPPPPPSPSSLGGAAGRPPAKTKSRLSRIDFPGTILLVSCMGLLLTGLNAATTDGIAWSHPLVSATLPLAASLLTAFVYVEGWRAAEPIIPVRLLRQRSIAGASLAIWFDAMALFTLMYYVPLYLQVQGRSTTRIGLLLLPESVGFACGSVGTGAIIRATGRCHAALRVAVLTTFVSGAAGFAAAATFGGFGAPAALTECFLFLNGLGFGGVLTFMLLALLSVVPRPLQAVMTSTSYVARSTGSMIGITLASLAFRAVLAAQLKARFPDLLRPGAGGSQGDVEQRMRAILDRCHLAGGGAGRERQAQWEDADGAGVFAAGFSAVGAGGEHCPPGVLESYMQAVRAAFVAALLFALLGMLGGLLVKEHKLRSTLNDEASDEGDGE